MYSIWPGQASRSLSASLSFCATRAVRWRKRNCQYMSSAPPLKRPPSRDQHHENNSSTQRKWRTHAVNLFASDYTSGSYSKVDEEKSTQNYEWEADEYELSEEVRSIQTEIDSEKERWTHNALPKERSSKIDDFGRAYGRGGRKTASARVWIQPGFGLVVVNNTEFVEYFERASDRDIVLAPLAATRTCGQFDIVASVAGGGLTGQAGAMRHGIARALDQYNPDQYRPPLKRLGFLSRDPRKVERKKVGHLKARKKPQWVKR